VFINPPPTNDTTPDEMFAQPPTTAAQAPDAVLPIPPTTSEPVAFKHTMFEAPPVIVPKQAATVLLHPAPTVEKLLEAVLTRPLLTEL
jgi:hypothetical protein